MLDCFEIRFPRHKSSRFNRRTRLRRPVFLAVMVALTVFSGFNVPTSRAAAAFASPGANNLTCSSPADASITPNPVSFGNFAAGQESTQNLCVYFDANYQYGSAVLEDNSGGFTIASQSCEPSSPGPNCAIGVQFHSPSPVPSGALLRHATLEVNLTCVGSQAFCASAAPNETPLSVPMSATLRSSAPPTTSTSTTETTSPPPTTTSTTLPSPSPTSIAVSANPTSLVVNGAGWSTVSATVMINGRPAQGDAVHFADPGVCGSLSPSITTTNSRGIAVAIYRAAIDIGTCTIVVTAFGVVGSRDLAVQTITLAGSGLPIAFWMAMALVVLLMALLAWKFLPGGHLRGTWQAHATSEPNHPCKPGTWHCQRPEPEFEIRERKVDSADITCHDTIHIRTAETLQLSSQALRDLNRVLRAYQEGSVDWAKTLVVEVAESIIGFVCRSWDGQTVLICANLHVVGPAVSVPFKLTRCTRHRQPGRLAWKWQGKVQDEQDFPTPLKEFVLNDDGRSAAAIWLANSLAQRLHAAANRLHGEFHGEVSLELS
jgi:hypothetical protein